MHYSHSICCGGETVPNPYLIVNYLHIADLPVSVP